MLPFDKQCFIYAIGYKDDKKIIPVCICCPKLSIFSRDFDKTKCIYFLIKEEKAFDKHNEIWEKVSNISEKEFNNELVYNEKHLKAVKKRKM